MRSKEQIDRLIQSVQDVLDRPADASEVSHKEDLIEVILVLENYKRLSDLVGWLTILP